VQFCWVECWYASQRSTLLTHIGKHRPGLVLDPINRVASTHREMAFQPGSQKEKTQTAQSARMLVRNLKRHSQTTAQTNRKKLKKVTQSGAQADGGTSASILVSAAAVLDDSSVFRPAAHIAVADVNFVSGDKEKDNMRGFAVHSFVLRLRSPVFAAMLDGINPGEHESPINLPDRGSDLKALFQCMYANDPHPIITDENVARLCAIAHKYGVTEIRTAALQRAHKLIDRAKLCGTKPTIPELLILGQMVQDDDLLAAVLKGSMTAFCTPLPRLDTAPIYCTTHAYQPLPCGYGCVAPAVDVLDDAARTRLKRLNPSTLVQLIETLATFRRKTNSRGRPVY
jgi:hypothetical protein